jgi:hypothetical protein
MGADGAAALGAFGEVDLSMVYRDGVVNPTLEDGSKPFPYQETDTEPLVAGAEENQYRKEYASSSTARGSKGGTSAAAAQEAANLKKKAPSSIPPLRSPLLSKGNDRHHLIESLANGVGETTDYDGNPDGDSSGLSKRRIRDAEIKGKIASPTKIKRMRRQQE